jgi:hypothetical protein
MVAFRREASGSRCSSRPLPAPRPLLVAAGRPRLLDLFAPKRLDARRNDLPPVVPSSPSSSSSDGTEGDEESSEEPPKDAPRKSFKSATEQRTEKRARWSQRGSARSNTACAPQRMSARTHNTNAKLKDTPKGCARVVSLF